MKYILTISVVHNFGASGNKQLFKTLKNSFAVNYSGPALPNYTDHSIIYLVLSMAMLICYCYCFLNSHFLIVRIDRQIPVPRSAKGIVRVKHLKQLCIQTSGSVWETDVKNALRFLKLSHYVVYTYFVAFIILLMAFGI